MRFRGSGDRDDHFTGLLIGDHPDELGTVGAVTEGRLAVDTSDVIARRPRAVLDLGLAGEVLLVSADAKVDAATFMEEEAKMGIPNRAHRRRHGQEGQSRCKLAMPKSAIYVGYHEPVSMRQTTGRSRRSAGTAHLGFPVAC
jgi:hypothetical protein